MKALHIYLSNFKYESRILKETESLVKCGLFDKIFIVALWETGLRENENLDDKREVWRVPLKTAVLPDGTFWRIVKYIEWVFKIFLRFKNESIKFVNCHNLSSLPIGVLFKMFSKSKVVYDTHELETERNGWSKIRRAIGKLLERSLIHQADIVIVVSESIARWYKDNYSLKNVHVVYNFPHRRARNGDCHSNVLKERFNIRDDEILFIYQGVLGRGRSIETLLNVFSKVDKKKHIVFMGYGVLENAVKEYENNFSNIHFQPAVKPKEVISYTKCADVGISLMENVCLSYFYCLPNKIFEYILSGLPVIVSDFPEMGRIVDENKCGWKVSVDEGSLLDLIKNVSSEDIKEKKNGVLKCRDNFDWHREEGKLLKIYYNLNRGEMKNVDAIKQENKTGK